MKRFLKASIAAFCLTADLCLAPAASASVAAEETVPEPAIDWAEARKFWSFQAPVRQALPSVRDAGWPKQPIDHFILARLESAGLAPSARAGKEQLVRRLAFALTGLPPSPEEVESFLKDERPDAWERLVNRYLESLRFGERMASLWLPLARYAEDQAHQVGNDTKQFYPNAYRYREWVIDAFNRDLPYDLFIRLQLAADLAAGARPEDQPALGFLGLGPKYYSRNRLDVMADEWEDRVDTVSRTFLGLTVACARCHDHKFDPITTRDYYGLAGIFASTAMANMTPGMPFDAAKQAKHDDPDTLHIVAEGQSQDLPVFIRGNVERKGTVVPRRYLQVLSEGDPVRFNEGSGRAQLAETLASPANPLTARVMVNRVWGEIFGRPLVATPSNFGILGEKPTHPELLDDLAVRFMEGGWSVKSLVREMVLSAAFAQDSRAQTAGQAADPENRLLWRMEPRRLPVEMWRDAVLEVSGQLLSSGDGRSLELDNPANLRRTVYSRISRLQLNNTLQQFDYPDANVHSEKRVQSTTPLQKLFVLNSPFMLEQAKSLAGRLTADPAEGNGDRVVRAYKLLYSRNPSSAELEAAMSFLGRGESAAMPRWEQYAQALLAANEMTHVD